MSFFSRLLQLRDILGPFVLGSASGDKELRKMFGRGPTGSGMVVTEETALTISAVWAAVNCIAGDIGSLPLHVYRKVGRGKEKADDLRLHYLLHDAPNAETSSAVWREYMQASMLLWGNGFSEIQWDNAGRPFALWPLNPERVSYDRLPTGELVYKVTRKNGTTDILAAEDVLHIPDITSNGFWGRSRISHARESLGLTMATEKFGATFFGNGSTFGGVLSHPTVLSDTAKDNLRDAVENLHRGVERAHKFLILEEGTKYERLGIPPEDAQFLTTRQHQVTEVARWFGIPPHKLADLLRATFTNIEQQSLDYVIHTLRRWLIRWEMELNRKLIGPLERNLMVIEFNLDGLLRGDTASRYAAYAVGRQWGWLSVNDIREKEGMNPLPAEQGDIYLVPTNMLPADRLDEVIDKQVEPAPAPVAPAPASAPEAKPAPAEKKSSPELALAHRAVVSDIVRRMLKREADKVVSAENLEDFYTKFGETFRSALLPACRMHIAMTGGDKTADALAQELVAEHIASSRTDLRACKFEERPALVERWQIERLSDIPDILQMMRGQDDGS